MRCYVTKPPPDGSGFSTMLGSSTRLVDALSHRGSFIIQLQYREKEKAADTGLLITDVCSLMGKHELLPFILFLCDVASSTVEMCIFNVFLVH